MQKVKYYKYHIYLAAAIFVMAVISGLCNRIGIWKSLVFVFFEIAFMFFPGTMIVESLKMDYLTKIEQILLSLFSGFLLNTIVYCLLMFVKGGIFLWPVCLLIFAASIFLFIKKEVVFDKEENVSFVWKTILILNGIIFLIYLFAFSVRNMAPVSIPKNSFYSDFLYWTGDIVALKQKVPPINFRTLAEKYSYHYLSSIQLAMMSKMTGIRAVEVTGVFSYIQTNLFLILSAVCLVNRLIKSKWGKILALILLFFTTGLEEKSVVSYVWHMYILPMSFTMALALELMVFLLMIIQLRRKKMDTKILVFMLLALALCTGSKGPIGALALVGIGIACIYWIFDTGEIKKALIYGGAALFVFSFIYWGILSDGNAHFTLEKENETQEAEADIVVNEEELAALEEVFGTSDIMVKHSSAEAFLGGIGKYIDYLWYCNPVTLTAAIIGMWFAYRAKKVAIGYYMLFITCAVGTFLGHKLNYYGQSQMYFTLGVLPLAAICAGYILTSLYDKYVGIYIKKEAASYVVLCVLTIVLVWFSYANNLRGYLNENLLHGAQNLIGKELEWDDSDSSLTTNEYEAYEWLLKNTEEDTIVISDRYMNFQDFSMVVGVYSERMIYSPSDTNDITRLYCLFEGATDVIPLYEEKGVEYIVCTNRITPRAMELLPEDQIAYSNDEVVIYELY